MFREPCERTEFSDFVWINRLLDSNVSRRKQRNLHMKDVWATWFGVPYYQSTDSRPQLYTYSRLQNLLQRHTIGQVGDQYPALVSFYGDTGGGKSTLIRALIRNNAPDDDFFDAPVPGNQVDLNKSTSGDVHLYADPLTINTEGPLFYAGKFFRLDEYFMLTL
jgi:hypothetical protein